MNKFVLFYFSFSFIPLCFDDFRDCSCIFVRSTLKLIMKISWSTAYYTYFNCEQTQVKSNTWLTAIVKLFVQSSAHTTAIISSPHDAHAMVSCWKKTYFFTNLNTVSWLRNWLNCLHLPAGQSWKINYFAKSKITLVFLWGLALFIQKHWLTKHSLYVSPTD